MSDNTADSVEAWLNAKSAELRERMRRVGNGDGEAMRIAARAAASEEPTARRPTEREDAATLAMLRRINRREREGR